VHNCSFREASQEEHVDFPQLPRFSRRRFLALAAALWAPLTAMGADLVRPLPSIFDPARDPALDLENAVRIARAARRNILVEIGGQWCPWCRIMDQFFTANRDLRLFRDANYVLLKVYFSPEEDKNEAFMHRFPPVAGYPHLYVLDGNGRLLHSQDTSALEAGKNYDPVAMRAFLVKWAPVR
jgi:thiol:disulfide interchange protein